MKRLFAMILALLMIFALPACKKAERQNAASTETQDSAATDSWQDPADAPFTPISSVQDYFDVNIYAPPEKVGNIQYLFHEPIRDTGKAYPLIIFLHGLGDQVNEYSMGTAGPLVNSLIRLENESEQYSAYTLVPETPFAKEGWWKAWQLDYLKQLIIYLGENYNIDTKRIYVTGISMGGYITCRLVNTMPPDTFAAAVPLSGAYDMKKPDAVMNTAFRIYHSAQDTVVNVSCSQSLYQQLVFYKHPNVEYVEYSEGNHISPLYRVYYDPSFYEWLFAQRLP